MMMPEAWTVVEKATRKADDGHQLVLVCERNGRRREAVVSGFTWEPAEVGKTVMLAPER
jgi:hypothetical protein